MMDIENTAAETADYINELLYADSGVTVPREDLVEAIWRDYRSLDDTPTREECEDLVMGEEGDPQVDALRERYSAIDAVIAAQF